VLSNRSNPTQTNRYTVCQPTLTCLIRSYSSRDQDVFGVRTRIHFGQRGRQLKAPHQSPTSRIRWPRVPLATARDPIGAHLHPLDVGPLR